MASNSNSREVCVEVYVNGELYCIDSVEVPDEENVQLEFMVTDRIYELLGCSPGDITARLEVDTDKCISVSRAALEGEDVQIDVDVKPMTCTTAENSPTESTTEWVKRKMSGFFQGNFWMDPAVPEQTPDKDRVPEPEANLVTVRWPAEEPGNKKYSPKRVMKKMRAVFKKYFPLDQAEPSSDPETEPVSADGQELDVSDGMDASPETAEMNGPRENTEEKKMRAFFKKYFPLDQAEPSSDPETEPVSAEGQEVDVTNGMDASPETAEMNGPRESSEEKKMRAFFKIYFSLDPSEPSCVPDASVPEPEPVSAEGPEVDISDGMDDQGGTDASPEKVKMKKMMAFFKKYFPLDQAEISCDPETEPVSADGQELDISDGMDASSETAEMNGPRESAKKKKMKAFFKKYFPLDQAEISCDPETEPVSADGQELDVSDGMDASSETAEMNGPRESTTAWAMRKIIGFFQIIFWMNPAVPEPTPEKDRVPEPEANLVGVSCPGSSSEIEMNGPRESAKKKKMRAFFKKYFPLDQAEPSSDPETEPVSADGQELDISDGMDASPETAEMNGPRESTTAWAMRKMSGFFQIIFWMNPAVPEPTPEKDRVPEPEANLVGVSCPGSSSEIEMNGPRENTEEKKMKAFFKKYFPLDQAEPSSDPGTEPVSADGQELDVSDGMDASSETAEMNGPRESTTAWAMRKMSGFIQTLLWMDPAVPEPTPEKDRVPEPEANLVGVSCPGSSSEIEMNGPRESTEEKKMRAFFKKYFPLDQAEPSCNPELE